MDLELEIKPFAFITEVNFLDTWIEDENNYMFEEIKKCLVWNPNKAVVRYCDMQRISTLEGEGNFSVGLILELIDTSDSPESEPEV